MRSFVSIAVLFAVGATGSYPAYYTPSQNQPRQSIYSYQPSPWNRQPQYPQQYQPWAYQQQPFNGQLPQPLGHQQPNGVDKTLKELQDRIQQKPVQFHSQYTAQRPQPQQQPRQDEQWGSPQQQQCPPAPCQSFAYDPVCAFAADGSTKEFNSCDYQPYVRCNPGKYVRSEKGRCSDKKSAMTPEQQRQQEQERRMKEQQKQQQLQNNQQPRQDEQWGSPQQQQCPPAPCQSFAYDPVCAFAADGSTKEFNSCDYQPYVRCNPGKYVRSERGRCADKKSEMTSERQRQHDQERRMKEQQQQQQCPPAPCASYIYDPVCAFAADGSTKEFNSCEYQPYVRCNPGKYVRSEKGRCADKKSAITPEQQRQQEQERRMKEQQKQQQLQNNQQPRQDEQWGSPQQQQCPPAPCQSFAYDPVCAFAADGSTKEFNSCDYQPYVRCNPGKYVRSEKGRCSDKKSERSQEQLKKENCAQAACPMNFDPVCAYAADGTTRMFGNACSYNNHAKCNPKQFVRSERGDCPSDANKQEQQRKQREEYERYQRQREQQRMQEQKQQQNNQHPQSCEQSMCAMNYDPVCAYAADGKTKVFSNACAYDNHVKCNPKSFVRVEKGSCPSQ